MKPLELSRKGCDSKRTILTKATGEFDFLLNDLKIDLQISNITRSSYDIKVHKAERMKNDRNSVIVFYIVDKQSYMLVNKGNLVGPPTPNPAWGGKPTYKVKSRYLTKDQLKEVLSEI